MVNESYQFVWYEIYSAAVAHGVSLVNHWTVTRPTICECISGFAGGAPNCAIYVYKNDTNLVANIVAYITTTVTAFFQNCWLYLPPDTYAVHIYQLSGGPQQERVIFHCREYIDDVYQLPVTRDFRLRQPVD